jgi:predicted RNA-binding Zn-ribbon protein involved in translation (DUF1610 family)
MGEGLKRARAAARATRTRYLKLLPDYRVECPHCGDVKRRAVWSVAHSELRQTYTCPKCGKQSILRANAVHPEG